MPTIQRQRIEPKIPDTIDTARPTVSFLSQSTSRKVSAQLSIKSRSFFFMPTQSPPFTALVTSGAGTEQTNRFTLSELAAKKNDVHRTAIQLAQSTELLHTRGSFPIFPVGNGACVDFQTSCGFFLAHFCVYSSRFQRNLEQLLFTSFLFLSIS